MGSYDRNKQLKEIHAAKKANTLNSIDKAIKELIKAEKRIDFKSVSETSGISRATLYRIPEVKTRIEELRLKYKKNIPGNVSKSISDSSKDALIASLKRRIDRLTTENKALKQEIERLSNENTLKIYNEI